MYKPSCTQSFFGLCIKQSERKKTVNNIECQADNHSPSSITITRRVFVNVIVQDYLYSPFTVKFARISVIDSSTLEFPDVKKRFVGLLDKKIKL